MERKGTTQQKKKLQQPKSCIDKKLVFWIGIRKPKTEKWKMKIEMNRMSTFWDEKNRNHANSRGSQALNRASGGERESMLK